MTPKEKALDIAEKMGFIVGELMAVNYIAKSHALIAVSEIIKANPITPLEFMLESEALDAANQYWTEVKQEIERL